MDDPTDIERTRERHRPSRIRVLMLGESPPRGRGFFYTGDSTLFRCTVPVLVRECGFPDDQDSFLARFKEEGFYLHDFSSERGRKPVREPESGEVKASVGRVAELISCERPVVVLGLLRGLLTLVTRSVESSDAPDTPFLCLRFPYHRDEDAKAEYQSELASALRAHLL